MNLRQADAWLALAGERLHHQTGGGVSGPLYGTAFLRAASVYARAESPSMAVSALADVVAGA